MMDDFPDCIHECDDSDREFITAIDFGGHEFKNKRNGIRRARSSCHGRGEINSYYQTNPGATHPENNTNSTEQYQLFSNHKQLFPPINSGEINGSTLPLYQAETRLSHDVSNGMQCSGDDTSTTSTSQHPAIGSGFMAPPGSATSSVANIREETSDSSLSEQSDKVFPAVLISPGGLITVLLEKDIAVEMTMDRAIRIVNHRHSSVAAVNRVGDLCCIHHQSAKIYHDTTTTEASIYWQRRVRMCSEGIVYAYGPPCYLLSPAHGLMQTSHTFQDLSRDMSVTVLFTSRGYGPHLMELLEALVSNAQYDFNDDGGVIVEINKCLIKQVPNGDVTVTTDDHAKFLRVSPDSGSVWVDTSFCEMSVQMNYNVKIKRGAFRMHASYNGMIVTDGIHDSGFTASRQPFLRPVVQKTETIIRNGRRVDIEQDENTDACEESCVYDVPASRLSGNPRKHGMLYSTLRNRHSIPRRHHYSPPTRIRRSQHTAAGDYACTKPQAINTTPVSRYGHASTPTYRRDAYRSWNNQLYSPCNDAKSKPKRQLRFADEQNESSRNFTDDRDHKAQNYSWAEEVENSENSDDAPVYGAFDLQVTDYRSHGRCNNFYRPPRQANQNRPYHPSMRRFSRARYDDEDEWTPQARWHHRPRKQMRVGRAHVYPPPGRDENLKKRFYGYVEQAEGSKPTAPSDSHQSEGMRHIQNGAIQAPADVAFREEVREEDNEALCDKEEALSNDSEIEIMTKSKSGITIVENNAENIDVQTVGYVLVSESNVTSTGNDVILKTENEDVTENETVTKFESEVDTKEEGEAEEENPEDSTETEFVLSGSEESSKLESEAIKLQRQNGDSRNVLDMSNIDDFLQLGHIDIPDDVKTSANENPVPVMNQAFHSIICSGESLEPVLNTATESTVHENDHQSECDVTDVESDILSHMYEVTPDLERIIDEHGDIMEAAEAEDDVETQQVETHKDEATDSQNSTSVQDDKIESITISESNPTTDELSEAKGFEDVSFYDVIGTLYDIAEESDDSPEFDQGECHMVRSEHAQLESDTATEEDATVSLNDITETEPTMTEQNSGATFVLDIKITESDMKAFEETVNAIANSGPCADVKTITETPSDVDMECGQTGLQKYPSAASCLKEESQRRSTDTKSQSLPFLRIEDEPVISDVTAEKVGVIHGDISGMSNDVTKLCECPEWAIIESTTDDKNTHDRPQETGEGGALYASTTEPTTEQNEKKLGKSPKSAQKHTSRKTPRSKGRKRR